MVLERAIRGNRYVEIFKQLFCFFLDGTSRHIVYFDTLKEDAGYAAAIETDMKAMLSSHSVKRFFKAFSWFRIWLFRRLLQQLFLWRLKLSQPKLIELGIDTMVMDNDEANRRHGVEPTYKKVKGFQPLQMTWGRFIIDAVFRGGKKHSNHGNTVEHMVRHIVGKIRKSCGEDALILIRMDAGFFDEKLFKVFEELKIGYICTGKIYEDIKIYARATQNGHWARYQKGKACLGLPRVREPAGELADLSPGDLLQTHGFGRTAPSRICPPDDGPLHQFGYGVQNRRRLQDGPVESIKTRATLIPQCRPIRNVALNEP